MPRALVPALLAGALLLSAGLPASSAAAAGDNAVLSRAGEAVEVRGPRTRVIAFYERRPQAEGTTLDVTILLSGGVLGREVLRTRMPLAEGQVHAITLGGGDASAGVETYRFARNGDRVTIDVDFADAVTSATGAEADEPAMAGAGSVGRGAPEIADASY